MFSTTFVASRCSVGESDAISRRIRSHEEKFWFKRPIVERASYIKIADPELRKQIERILIRFLKSNTVLNRQHVARLSRREAASARAEHEDCGDNRSHIDHQRSCLFECLDDLC